MLTFYESSRGFLGLWSLSSLLMLFLIAFCGLEKNGTYGYIVYTSCMALYG